MHSRTDNKSARPKAMRPHNPRLFSYLHPRLQIPVVSSPQKDSKRNESNQRKGGEWGRPRLSGGSRNPGRQAVRDAFRGKGRVTAHLYVFPAEAGIQRCGEGGHPLTPTPFPDDKIRATLPPCTAAQTKMGARPQRRSAHTTPGCFPIYTLQLQIGLFPPGAKNSKRNESNQRESLDEVCPRLIILLKAGTQRCEAFWEAIPERIA